MSIASVPFNESLVDWLWISLGVLLAVVWPRLRAEVAALFGQPTAAAGQDLRKAAVLLGFCVSTAIIVLAIYRSSEPDKALVWYVCLLAGFGWEAAFEKLTGLSTRTT